jgi:hypothetical protein
MHQFETYVYDELGYLNDHLAGAAAAIQHIERMRGREPESELGHVLQALRGEIEEDRDVLERIVVALGGSANPVKRAGALGAEILASVRMQMPVLGAGSSEAARLEEIEVLSLGIEGKRLLWTALAEVARSDPRLSGFDLASLARRAQEQRDRLERFRLRFASAVLGRHAA